MGNSDKRIFISRVQCIACGSGDLSQLSDGKFGDQPLRSFLEGDPWGENPISLLEDEQWSFVSCGDCNQKFHQRILSHNWNDIRFNKWMSEDAIREFEQLHMSGKDRARSDAQHVLRLKSLGVRSILDFGCGFGQFLEMCRLFGIEATGVDRSGARRDGSSVKIYSELRDVSGPFDAITMFEVLEHLDEPLTMLRELRNFLVPNGVMIVEVPDTSGITEIKSRKDYVKIHPLDHINAFTPTTLTAIMARAGFHPIIKSPAFVTMSFGRLIKDVAKYALKQNSTQRYFRMGP